MDSTLMKLAGLIIIQLKPRNFILLQINVGEMVNTGFIITVTNNFKYSQNFNEICEFSEICLDVQAHEYHILQ
jgi:hypothetical protein